MNTRLAPCLSIVFIAWIATAWTPASADNLEVGTVQVNGGWTTLNFQNSYTRPGATGGVAFEAGTGTATVKGIEDDPPYTYPLVAFSTAPLVGLVTPATMNGNDGAWPVLFGANPLRSDALDLAMDEDQKADPERQHPTGERVAYWIFEAPVSLQLAPVSQWPYASGFEPDDYAPGDLHGQDGWRTDYGVAQVRDHAGISDSQAADVSPLSEAGRDFLPDAASVLWLDVATSATPSPNLPDPGDFGEASCLLVYHEPGGITCLDGNGLTTGAWTVTGISPDPWTRLTARVDYAARRWDLYIDGLRALQGLGFKDNSVTQFCGFNCGAGDSGPMQLDDFSVANEAPTGPFIHFSAEEIVFEPTMVGETVQASIVVTNDGAAPLQVEAACSNSDGFRIRTALPGTALEPGQDCTVEIEFAPTESKPYTATLQWTITEGARTISPATPLTGETTNAGAQYTPHGELKPFWRYSAALGGYNGNDYLSNGQGLKVVPEYMCSGNDFPYQKRPYAVEKPFADHLSVVRFLGGYLMKDTYTLEEISQLDLAYRDDEGVVQYRMELVESRLRPYLDAGYTSLTLVLDNIPWGMTDAPEEANYGNVGIPYDFDVWADFIETLCREVSAVSSGTLGNNLRFRAGTEFQGIKRYHGSGDADFMAYYNASWSGIAEVFPDAGMGPFNISGVSIGNLDNSHNVNAFNIPSLRDPGTPFDWVSFSHYFLPGERPDTLVDKLADVWDEFEVRYPGIHFSREIHEFGIQPWTNWHNPVVHMEPGALGTATTLQTLLGLWNRGLDRCWHWGLLDQFGTKREGYIPEGDAWIFSVLDRMRGGDAHYLTSVNASAHGTHWVGMSSKKETEAFILLNAYNESESERTSETAVFRIPKDASSPLDLDRLQYTAANRNTMAHDIIRADLARENHLVPFFRDNPDLCGQIKEMAEDEGLAYLKENKAKYEQAWDDALTLKPIDDRDCTVTDHGTYYELSIEMNVPEALVIRALIDTETARASCWIVY